MVCATGFERFRPLKRGRNIAAAMSLPGLARFSLLTSSDL
jgi:hypothetical protein